jgi:hypothetical protein
VADGVDLPVQVDQPSRLPPVPDRFVRQPEIEQLRVAHHAFLPGGEVRDPAV